ncbi:MAG: TolC family protein [Bacteroidales bacterium]|nr:TolC family protein [Bacteroidales bacterium]
MLKIRNTILLSLLILLVNFSSAQNNSSDSSANYSLEELKNYAIEHNYQIQNSELDIKKSKAIKWETTAIGLPQVSGSLQYENFTEIPTQLMPNFIAPAVYDVNTNAFGLTPLAPFTEGNKIPIQFGNKYNADWGVSVSQIIFSGEYIVGLRASKIYMNLSEKSKDKSIIEVKENIEKTYYLILITEESIIALDSVYSSIAKLLGENEKLYEAGFLEETDVEQLKLNLKSTENSLISFKKQKEILYRLLKFQSGIDYNQKINISGKLSDAIEEIEENNLFAEEFNINQNIDYQLIQVQESLADLSLQREKTKTLPSVVGFYSYQKKAMLDSLNFFSEDAEWYPTSVWGIKVSIPIFSSGQRYAKIKQAQFDLEKMQNLKSQTKQALMLETEQTKADFLTAINTVRNTSEQRHLAKKIYENSYKKFKIGTEQSFNLALYQTQYFQALTSYYQALNQLIDKHISLKRLMNQL